MKVNKMCGYRCFNVISDKRAHSDGPFSVNFRPFDLMFGPVERGDQGLSNGPLFSMLGPKFAFSELRKVRLTIANRLPSLTGRRSQPQSIVRPLFALRLDHAGHGPYHLDSNSFHLGCLMERLLGLIVPKSPGAFTFSGPPPNTSPASHTTPIREF